MVLNTKNGLINELTKVFKVFKNPTPVSNSKARLLYKSKELVVILCVSFVFG